MVDDGTSRQGSWKGGREREKSSEASQNSPLTFAAEVDVDSFTKWPSDDLQAQAVRRALGRLCSGQRITALCGGVLLICLRVRLVTGE